MAVHLISRARYFRPLLLVSVPHFLSTLTTAFKLLLGISFPLARISKLISILAHFLYFN